MAQPDAHEIAGMLAARIASLAAELLPAGKRIGHEWVVDPRGGDKISVHLGSGKAGIWKCWNGGETGDALALVAFVLFGGKIKDALDWSRDWLGLPSYGTCSGAAPVPTRREPAQQDGPDRAAEDQAARRAKALGLFLSARAGLAGTPAALYLARRGIDLGELGRAPGALRFHPAAWCSEIAAPLPAMLAAITNGAGEHVATHRTWIARTRGGQWVKAPLKDAKKSLGNYAGGFVPLQRGASGRPLRDAPEGETVAIAEGIETALSVAISCPELRVVAAVSVSNMARVILPDAVRTVILCIDNDRPENYAVERALTAAIDHFAGQKRTVRLARPPAGKDFNDTLRAVG
jgi:hypothetical protein